MATDEVRDAYGAQAEQLAQMLGTQVSDADRDRSFIEPWANAVTGRILDVGSGTGRWAGHLADLGHEVEGLEPVQRFVNLARTAHPRVDFRLGDIDDLAGSDDRWAGLLAWYSLIHLGPEDLRTALAILHAVLDEDGTMLMSFFAGPRIEPFNHPVATAYRWPLTEMARVMAEAGFEVVREHGDEQAPHAVMLVRS